MTIWATVIKIRRMTKMGLNMTMIVIPSVMMRKAKEDMKMTMIRDLMKMMISTSIPMKMTKMMKMRTLYPNLFTRELIRWSCRYLTKIKKGL